MYDATLGRFLQRDPRGYADGTVLHEYARGAPTRYRDEFGREVTADPKLDYQYWDERMFSLARWDLKRARRDNTAVTLGTPIMIGLIQQVAALDNAEVEVHYVDRVGQDMVTQFAQDVAQRARKEVGGIYLYFGHGTGTGGFDAKIDRDSLKEFTEALKGLNSEKRGIGVLCCYAGDYLQGIPQKARMTTPLTMTSHVYVNDASAYCKENEKKILAWASGVQLANNAAKDKKLKIHLYFGAMGAMDARDKERYKETPKERPVFRNWQAIGLKPDK